MKVITSIEEFRSLCAEYHAGGKTIGFVPTMGAFHAGHLSLMHRARQENDVVLVSIFVNPLQFGAAEDLEKYPRDLAADEKLARGEKADVMFAPGEGEFYPPGFSAHVAADKRLASIYEGETRPGHFDGVCTVLARLFGLVGGCRAYMGQKDYQQYLVVHEMTRERDIDVRVVLCPTVREESGLAMSSRNAYFDGKGREKALCLQRSLVRARSLVEKGERDAAKLKGKLAADFSRPGVALDYIAIADAEKLEPLERIEGDVVVAVAAEVDGVRLIDNELLRDV